MRTDLFIEKRLAKWAETWPELKKLNDSRYGRLLTIAYERLNTSILYMSDTHGRGHIERTMLYGALCSMHDELSAELTEDVLLCCSYHDIGRVDDRYDEEHGHRSADKIEMLSMEKLFHYPKAARAAIHAHAKPDREIPAVMELYEVENTEIYSILVKELKDADNLDRVRIYDLNPDFLRSDKTKQMVPMAKWILDKFTHIPTILCYGDSNTYGLNPYYGGRYPEFMRWPRKLQSYLGEEWRVIENGMIGRTTAFDREDAEWKNGLKTLEPVLYTSFPIDVIIFMLGTNDCNALLNLTAEEITAGMEALVLKARSFLNGLQGYVPDIIIAAPHPFDERMLSGPYAHEATEKSMEVSRRLPKLYEELAERLDCGYINLEPIVRLSSADGEHFYPFDGRRVARAIAEIIAPGGDYSAD